MTTITRNYRFSSPMDPDHIKISNTPSAVAFTVASNNMNYLAGNGTQLIPMSPMDIPFAKGDTFTFYLPVTPYPNVTKRRHTLLFETSDITSYPPVVTVQIGHNTGTNPAVSRSFISYPYSNIHAIYYDEQVYTGSAQGSQNGMQMEASGVSFITGTLSWINNGTATTDLKFIGLETFEYPLQSLNLEDPFNTTPYSGSASTGSWTHGANITNPVSFHFNDYIYSQPSASNLGNNLGALVRQVDTGRSWVRGRAGLFFWSSNHTGTANKAFHVTSSAMIDIFKDVPVQVERKYNENQVTNDDGDKASPYYLWVRYNTTSTTSGTLHFCNTTTTTSIDLPDSSTPVWTYKQILDLRTDSTISGSVPAAGRDKFSIRLRKDGGGGGMRLSALALIQHRPGAVLPSSSSFWDLSYSTMTFARETSAWYQTGAATDGSSGYLSSYGINTLVYENLGDGAGSLLRIEHATTNSLLRSDEFDNAAWSTFGAATITAGQGGPVGSTAERIEVAAGTNIRYQNLTPGAGWRSYSAYVRATTGTPGGYIYLYDGSTTVAEATLSTTYQRLQNKMNCGAGAGNFGAVDSRAGSTVGAGARDIRISMGQLEPGRYATSPILSEGTAGTRGADILTLPAASVPPGLLTSTAQFTQFSPEWGSADLASGDERWLLNFDSGGVDGIRVRHDGTNILLEAVVSNVVKASATFGTFSKNALLGTISWDPSLGLVYINGTPGSAGTAWTWASNNIRIGGKYGAADEADARFGTLKDAILLNPTNFIAGGTSAWDMGFSWTDPGAETAFALQRSGSDTSPITITGAQPELWVKWDRGITSASLGSTEVTGWRDMSGTGTDLTQSVSANRPKYLTGSLYFDGTNDYLSAPGAGTAQTTKFIVGMRVQPESLGGTMVYGARSNSAGGYWSAQNAGEMRMWVDTPGTNGIAVANSFLTASQMQALLWVYDGAGAGNSTRLRCWVNGNQVSSSYYGTIPASLGAWGTRNYTIGSFADPTQYFQGYMDEMFVINATPDATVIGKLNQYLMNDLAGITQSWQTISTPAANATSDSEGGQWSSTNVGSRSLTPGRSYNYRLSASNASVTTNWVYDSGSLSILSASYSPDIIFGSQLLSWHRADSFVSVSAGKVEKWGDITSNARHFIQATSANQPTTSTLNEQPSFKFTSATPTYLDLTGSATYGSPNAVHIIRVVAAADPALANASSGLDEWGTSVAQTHYPFTDGVIYDATAGTTRATVGNPTPSLANLNVYSSISTNTAFTASLNGQVIYTGASLGVAIKTSPRLGGTAGTQQFNGHLCEVLVVSASSISTYQHRMLSKYFYNRYGINVAPSGSI